MILIIEDDPYISSIIDEIISHLGYATIIKKTVSDAISFIDKGGLSGVRMILSDFMLPDGNGLQLIHYARNTLPDIPAAIISGYADAIIPESVEFIRKPFKISHIESLLNRCLAA